MKLRLLSQKAVKYGFSLELLMTNKKGFNGHQIGICIGIRDAESNAVKQNYIPDDEFNIKFDKMLEDKELLLLQDTMTQLEDDKLKKRYAYYLPYYVVDHSAYKPTINFEQISYACNVMNTVQIEVLFVDDSNEYNRYMVLELKTGGDENGYALSLLRFIDDIEEIIEEMAADEREFKYAKAGDPKFEPGNIILDMYDKVGNRIDAGYSSVSNIKDMISSVRIIGLDTKINKE